jgi:hypothetical protein
VDRLLAATERLASVDPDARVQRDAALVALGRTSEGLADAAALASRDLVRGAPYVVGYAEMLARSGRSQQASEVLVKELLVLHAHDRDPGGALVVGIWTALRRAGVPVGLEPCTQALSRDSGWTGPLPDECRVLAGEAVLS